MPFCIHHVDVPGGAIKRAFIHGLMRLTIKRFELVDPDIPALRRKQHRWDSLLAHKDSLIRRSPVESDLFLGQWIDSSEEIPERIILYVHGGAFISHWPRIYSAMLGRWCRRLKARALMVDYRLAPEFPFPAAADDCFAAYTWLLEQGHAAHNIVIAGDSAGANLALVTLRKAQASHMPLPAFGVLMSAFLDFTLSSRSMLVNARRDPMFTLAQLAALRSLYASPARFLDPSVSPLFGSFAGLPPLLFQVGARELLLDDSIRAAKIASDEGVLAEAQVWNDMGHVFQALPTPQAAAAIEHVAKFIAV